MSNETSSPITPFVLIDGESGVRALVERFYDLMELEPGYAVLRGVHGADLASAQRLPYRAWALGGMTGHLYHRS